MTQYEITIQIKQTITADDQLTAMMTALKGVPSDAKVRWVDVDEVDAD